jgi:ring-1,2-phenylacetyl-CoA epoxidase subunit PaaD
MVMNVDQVRQELSVVTDPEVPVLSLDDLGVLRDISVNDKSIIVTITPTYSGCPAVEMMIEQIKSVLTPLTQKEVKVEQRLSPAWTTDWMSEKGKKALFDYGIMPPTKSGIVICPQCQSKSVSLISQFGSTACKALYKCEDCLEPFDYFKCH